LSTTQKKGSWGNPLPKLLLSRWVAWNAANFVEELEDESVSQADNDMYFMMADPQKTDSKQELGEGRLTIKEQTWSQPKRRKKVIKRSMKTQAMPTRQSARVVKDGVSSGDNASRWVEEPNNISGNSFAILNSVDKNVLSKLVVDVGVQLGNDGEEALQQIDAFRAQELDQMAIDKLEVENRRKKLEQSDKMEGGAGGGGGGSDS
jgi:hypothetical protein